jgi:DNA-binding transcriptional LysR family regulator
MLDVNRLLILRELHMRGSMAAVAEALNFSSSAISQQIAQLEREVKQPLIRRVGRGVQLTPQALLLVESAAELADILERTETELLHFHDTVSGTVRVAVFQSAALALIPTTLREMTRRHPDVRVEVVQKEPAEAVRGAWSREFDIVIAEEYPAHSRPTQPGLNRDDLLKDEIQLATPPGSSILQLDEAAELPWVMEPPGTASRHFAELTCRTAGFEPDVRFETADLQAHIQLVETGNAVALIPTLLLRGRASETHMVRLESRPERTIYTVRRDAARQAPASDAFLELLRHTASVA